MLPAPADATATFGRAASRNGWVLAVFEPWWATFRRSTDGIPRASNSGSTPCSTSPISRNRWGPTSPSSTIETLLIDVPPSGGRSGTRFGSGQRTRSRIESRVRRSPVDSRPCGGPPFASTLLQASYPGPGPTIPGSYTRPTRYRWSSRARPATWSSCGWLSTRMSMRRSHGGRRSSSAIRSREGSGPPSTTSRPPRPPSTRIPSPCPTSSTTTRASPSGRWTRTRARPIVASTRAPAASCVARWGLCAAPGRRLATAPPVPAPPARAPPDAAPRAPLFGARPLAAVPVVRAARAPTGAVGCPRAARSPASHRSPYFATAKISTAETTAATPSHGATSSRLASGSPAPMRTTPTIAA